MPARRCKVSGRDTTLSSLVFASPVSRTGSDDAMKGSRERGLVSESRLHCHIAKRQFCLNEKFLRAINALANQPLVARNAKRSFECACKVANRKPALFCQVAKPNATVQILAE